MPFDRVFDGLEAFMHFTERLALNTERPFIAATGIVSLELHKNVTNVIGDVSKLRDLELSTQEERESLGYSANEPLLRDGSLLRDHVERVHDVDIAAVGSSEPVQRYMEEGYWNVRAGRFIEPRPAFEIGLVETEPATIELIEIALGAALGFE